MVRAKVKVEIGNCEKGGNFMIEPHGNLSAAFRVGRLLLISTLLAIGLAQSAKAQTCVPLGYAGDCNLLITVNPDGSITSTIPDSHAYDGTEDQYVGLLNKDPNLVVSSINLSGISIFEFDADGAFAGNRTCTFDTSSRFWDICSGNTTDHGFGCTTAYSAATHPCGTGGGTSGGPGDNGYASAGVHFSGLIFGNGFSTPDKGTILFLNGGLSNGHLGLFSLEGPASLSGISASGVNLATTPEPGTAVLWITGIGLMIVMRKRIAQLRRLDTGTHRSLPLPAHS
jgi:hypothetical protein